MAWNDNDQQQQEAPKGQPKAQPRQPAYNANSQADQNMYSDLFGMAAATASGTASYESLNTMIEVMNKVAVEPAHQQFGLKFLLVNDRTSAALPFILGYNTKGSDFGFYTFLIEELLYNGALQPIKKTISNQGMAGTNVVEIDNDTSRIYDETLVNLAQRVLKQTANHDFYPAGFMVVKRDKQLGNEQYSRLLFDTAKTALMDFLGVTPLVTAGMLARQGVRINVSHDITPGQNTYDLESTPISADFTVKMTATQERSNNNNVNESYNGKAPVLQLGTASGILDLLYAADSTVVVPSSHGAHPVTLPGYHPLLVMTDSSGFNPQTGQALENPVTVILNLLAMTQLASDHNYVSIYKRNATGGKKASLGMLGYQYEPDPTKPFEPRELKLQAGLVGRQTDPNVTSVDQIVRTFFYDTMTVAIDILKGGRASWTMELILASAMGVSEANETLIDLFDAFCDGQFRPLWGNQPLFEQDIVTIHAGTYIDDNGQECDIRDWDYLRLLSVYKQESLNRMADYGRTLVPGNSNGDAGAYCIDFRRQTLKQICNANITGLYDRVFLAPDLLKVFLDAVSRTGLKVVCEGLFDGMDTRYDMGTFRPGTAVNAQGIVRSGVSQHGAIGGSYLHGVNRGRGGYARR